MASIKHNQKKIKDGVQWLLKVFLLSLAINIFVAQRAIVEGESMEPSYHDGDNLIIGKLLFCLDGYDRFDTVILYNHGDILVKRVVGLPGECIRMKEDGSIYVNGVLLDDPYKAEPGYLGIAENVVALQSNEYFVLGDNRSNSADSRKPEIGAVAKEKIIGKVLYKIPNKKG